MKRLNFASLSALILTASITGHVNRAYAEDSQAVKDAKEKQDIAVANSLAAQAEQKTAEAKAAMAVAEQAQKNSSDTANFNAEKAKIDYYKSLIPPVPDFSKLNQADKPNTISVTSIFNDRLFLSTQNISSAIVSSIKVSIGDPPPKPKNDCDEVVNTVILDGPLIRSANSSYTAVDQSLILSQTILENERKLLQADLDSLPVKKVATKAAKGNKSNDQRWGLKFGPGAAMVTDLGSTLLQTFMAFTVALKPQFASAVVSITPTNSEFISSVTDQLLKNRFVVIDPEKIIPTKLSDELNAHLLALDQTITQSTALLEGIPNSNKTLSDEVIAEVKKFKATLDSINVIRQSIVTANQSGIVPFELAAKSKIILDYLKLPNCGILNVDFTRATGDSLAKESVFAARKDYTRTNIQVRWSYVKPDGEFIGSGIVQDTGDWESVNLPK